MCDVNSKTISDYESEFANRCKVAKELGREWKRNSDGVFKEVHT